MSKVSIAEAAAAVVGGGKTGGSHSANPVATGAVGLPNSNMGLGDKTPNKPATPDTVNSVEETPNETNVKPTKTSDTENKASIKMKSVKEDVDAMFDGIDLTEEGKQKVTVIFEAAVNAKVAEIVEEKAKELEESFDNQLQETVKELVENVNEYLDYIAEEWLKENILSVENKVKVEMAESFMAGLKQLFEDHYVTLPEDGDDIVSDLTDRINDLEEQLSKEVETNIEMKKQLSENKIKDIVSEAVDGLTDTQKDKIKSLAEGITYTDIDDFKTKLQTIKESYTSVKTGDTEKLNNDAVELTEDAKPTVKSHDPMINFLAKTVGKSVKR